MDEFNQLLNFYRGMQDVHKFKHDVLSTANERLTAENGLLSSKVNSLTVENESLHSEIKNLQEALRQRQSESNFSRAIAGEGSEPASASRWVPLAERKAAKMPRLDSFDDPDKGKVDVENFNFPVRGKAARMKLPGHSCEDCDGYYSSLPEDERKRRMNLCSRHRSDKKRPRTPESFWSLDFDKDFNQPSPPAIEWVKTNGRRRPLRPVAEAGTSKNVP